VRQDPPRLRCARPGRGHHVGTITLTFQGMQLEGTPGQRLGVYTAEPGTPDHDAMTLLDLTAPRHTATTAQQQPH
jgi:hypothetical protein